MARRKTLKKNEYQSFPNCYNSQDNFKGKWREEIFLSEGPLKLELGCGKAEFSYALAQKYPENNYLGIDLKMDRMWRPAGDALAASIDNLKFLCINLLDIGQYFEENEADEIWITFPDPFSKNRQAKHRMVNPSFMKQYKHILKPSASLHYKTDNLELFHYTLEVWAAEERHSLQDHLF